jgi:hypothetical protein
MRIVPRQEHGFAGAHLHGFAAFRLHLHAAVGDVMIGDQLKRLGQEGAAVARADPRVNAPGRGEVRLEKNASGQLHGLQQV